MSRPPVPELLSAAQVAEAWGVTPWWVREEARRGRLVHVELGRQVRFRPADLEAYLAERVVDPGPDRLGEGPARRREPARQAPSGQAAPAVPPQASVAPLPLGLYPESKVGPRGGTRRARGTSEGRPPDAQGEPTRAPARRPFPPAQHEGGS